MVPANSRRWAQSEDAKCRPPSRREQKAMPAIILLTIGVLVVTGIFPLAPPKTNPLAFAIIIVGAALVCFAIDLAFNYSRIGPDWVREIVADAAAGMFFLIAWRLVGGPGQRLSR
jgi:hypothetical protein